MQGLKALAGGMPAYGRCCRIPCCTVLLQMHGAVECIQAIVAVLLAETSRATGVLRDASKQSF